MRSTLLTANLGSAWNFLNDHGYRPDNLFEGAGIDPEALEKPEGRIDLNAAVELVENINALFDDPCLGLKIAKYWHLSQLQALGYAWFSSKTLREALERLVRYAKILNETLVHHLVENRGDLTVEVDFNYDFPPRVEEEFVSANLARLVLMCRMNYGQTLDPLAVTFKHAPPPCSGEYFALFKTNVRFEADKNSITFSKDLLDKALIGYNPQMEKYADQIALGYLAKLDQSDITQRVKVKIVEMLPSGDVTAKKIARKLYLSDRSFSRRLNEADTSFRELLEETRREMVSQYLKDKNIDLREIPYLLGYKNYSSFFKAYKRWTGQSPTGLTH